MKQDVFDTAVIFSHFQQLAQPTWLRRAQVDEPKPRPSVPRPDQLKLGKTGTTSRKMHPTITQQCFFFNITSRDGAPPNLSVAGIGCARLAPLALPRFRPAIHLGLEDLKTTRLPGLPGFPFGIPVRCQQVLKALILPPVQQIIVSYCFYIEQAPWQRKDWEVSVC